MDLAFQYLADWVQANITKTSHVLVTGVWSSIVIEGIPLFKMQLALLWLTNTYLTHREDSLMFKKLHTDSPWL